MYVCVSGGQGREGRSAWRMEQRDPYVRLCVMRSRECLAEIMRLISEERPLYFDDDDVDVSVFVRWSWDSKEAEVQNLVALPGRSPASSFCLCTAALELTTHRDVLFVTQIVCPRP